MHTDDEDDDAAENEDEEDEEEEEQDPEDKPFQDSFSESDPTIEAEEGTGSDNKHPMHDDEEFHDEEFDPEEL